MVRPARLFWCALSAMTVGTLVVVAACDGGEDVFRPAPSYNYDATTTEVPRPADPAPVPSVPVVSCGDAGDAPARVLVVNSDPPGELAAVNLDTRAVDGRLSLDGGLGVTSATGLDLWLLDQVHDVVTRLDAREPWKPAARWDVSDEVPGDDPRPAMPITVVQVSCTKAYVVRANRDRIAIIDPTDTSGRPSGWIDMASFRAAADTGTLDLAGAVWVPSKKKVFVLAGNVARGDAFPDAGLRCNDLRASIFGIDVTTDKVVSVAGKGVAGSIAIDGFDPKPGASLLYDAPFDRLLAVGRGCNPGVTLDGGTVARREIEQVELATGAVKQLLSLDKDPLPTGLALADGDHAAVMFGVNAYRWNPREPSLGAPLDARIIASDGRGAFIGARRKGASLELFALPLGDGGATTPIATDPFTSPGGTAASLEAWPRR